MAFCLRGGSKLFLLSVTVLRNGHLSHTLAVPCRPICRLRRGSMIGDVRRMMDDTLL